MYAAYKKERKGNSSLFRFKLVEEKISLFGWKNGWIPWLLEMVIPKGQDEPHRWHLHVEESLDWDKAKQWAVTEYKSNVNAIVINIKPGSDEFFLCELLDVWGFSDSGWTPMLWHLRVLEPKSTKCTPDHFDDFIAAESGDHVYEFLYAKGSVKKGKLAGGWIAPKSSPTNAALLWPESLNYFLNCINAEAHRNSK